MGAHRGFKLLGFHPGFEGLIRGDFEALQPRSVSNILQRGGMIHHRAPWGKLSQVAPPETSELNLH